MNSNEVCKERKLERKYEKTRESFKRKCSSNGSPCFLGKDQDGFVGFTVAAAVRKRDDFLTENVKKSTFPEKEKAEQNKTGSGAIKREERNIKIIQLQQSFFCFQRRLI